MVKIIERTTFNDDNTLEKTTSKIEIPGKINGNSMMAAVMNLHGCHLVIKDRTHDTGMIIKGENETDLMTLKSLLEKTTISITIQVPLNIPTPTSTDDG